MTANAAGLLLAVGIWIVVAYAIGKLEALVMFVLAVVIMDCAFGCTQFATTALMHKAGLELEAP